jgi:hypothetical protein
VEEVVVVMLLLQVEVQHFQGQPMLEQVAQVEQGVEEAHKRLVVLGVVQVERAHNTRVVMVEQIGPMVVVAVEVGMVVVGVVELQAIINVQEEGVEVLHISTIFL